MIALLQRVNWAQVRIEKELWSEIDKGLLVFVGIEKTDTEASADKLIDKLLGMRVFSDPMGKMNLNLESVNGGLLLVSQFTLAANTDKGLRPGFSSAMPPDDAHSLYNYLVTAATSRHPVVASGQFAADMKIALENDGPVTFIVNT